MRVVEDLDFLPRELASPILTIGVFDGVHLGHQEILKRVVSRAAEAGGAAVVLTFRPHPQKVISPGDAPLLLQTDEQKIELLEREGIDVLVRMPFTRKLSLLSPRQFVESVLHQRGLREVCVGSNFRFGHRRTGDFPLLCELAEECGIRVEGIEQVRMPQGRISSTRIRENLRLGRVWEASSMLGRPYEIWGTVVKGAGRGARLGFPTANLQVLNELIPAVGVYVTQVECDGVPVGSVTNIGVRPTLTPGTDPLPVVESHILDFDGNLYGQPLRLRFLKRLRAEKKFDDVEKLQHQIQCDIQSARDYGKRNDEDQARAG